MADKYKRVEPEGGTQSSPRNAKADD